MQADLAKLSSPAEKCLRLLQYSKILATELWSQVQTTCPHATVASRAVNDC